MKRLFLPLSFAGILCWWGVAFKSAPQTQPVRIIEAHQPSTPQLPLFSSLTQLHRDELQKALAGNTSLMAKMIADWDVDAQLIEDAGYNHTKRLPGKSYLRSQVLGRMLTQSKPRRLERLREQMRAKSVTDDAENTLDLAKAPRRFLPQTYGAASFLLALQDPKQIVALPRGLREQTQLFPVEVTSQVPIDVDRFNSEKLYLAKPDVAFIAHYSHPAMVDALRSQGIPLFTITKLDTIEDIKNALMKLGQVINRSFEAELMAIFMDAALLAIDNRMMALKEAKKASARILFVNYHNQFSLPGARTLTGQLLQRAGISQMMAGTSFDWLIPIDQESIVNFNPDCLIVATTNRQEAKTQLQQNPALSHLPVVQNQKVVFVDENIQQFPSQHIVLAYFDIYQAITCL